MFCGINRKSSAPNRHIARPMCGDICAPVYHFGDALNGKHTAVFLGQRRQIRRRDLQTSRVKAISLRIHPVANRALRFVCLLSFIDSF